MILDLVNLLLDTTSQVCANPIVSIVINIISFIAAAYLLWRLWAFTIHPMLKPQEPPELPYWIPILGHAMSFIKDAQTLVSRGRRYFHNSSAPFALTVGGKKLYVITSAADVNAVYKNNTTLSWDAMLNDLLIAFGIKAALIPKLWEKPTPDPSIEGPVPPHKLMSPIHTTLHHYKTQLLPGERLDRFGGALFGHISDALNMKNLSKQNGGATSRIPLTTFCGEILVEALGRAMFGNKGFEMEPDLVQAMLDFNDDAWMLIFQYPQGPDSKLHKARRKLLDFFMRYMNGPEETRSGQAWLMDEVLRDLSAIDMRDEDRAALLLMIFWGGNINPYKFSFWLISYILFDPTLLAALQEETRPAIQNGELDINHLVNHCPRLNAVFLETLRVTSGALSARKIVAPTRVGDSVLGAGNTILIPLRQLHYDQGAFGDKPDQFDSERFLRKKHLKASSSFRPYGGGVSHCPGQVLAKQEMLVFVALILNRFDIELATGTGSSSQHFPRIDEYTPSLGVNGPIKGSDVLLNFRQREV